MVAGSSRLTCFLLFTLGSPRFVWVFIYVEVSVVCAVVCLRCGSYLLYDMRCLGFLELEAKLADLFSV